jgi:TRAP-type C4-dicarboxylate transport system substrate-binding protein
VNPIHGSFDDRNESPSLTRGKIPKLACMALGVLLFAACAAEDSGSDDSEEGETASVDPDSADTAEPEIIELTYSTFLAESSPDGQEVLWWMDRVNEILDDYELEFESHFAGALLPGHEMVAAIADEQVDMGYVANPYFPAELPLTQIIGVPFISESGEVAVKTFRDLYATDEAYRAEWHDRGLRPIVWSLTTNAAMGLTEPAETVADLEGRRIRGLGYPSEAVELVGMDPVIMEATEIYESLDRGVVSGYILPFANAVTGFRTHEVAPHFLDAGLGQWAIAASVTMPLGQWEDLPEEVQDAMEVAGQEMATEFMLPNLQSQDEAACDEVLEAGGVVNRLSDEEIEEWRELAGESIIELWRSQAMDAGVAEDVIDEFETGYLNTIERYEDESDYVDGLTLCAERSD